VLKNFPKQTEPRAGERVGIAAALALVPPAVNAFKDVASVFRVEDTLHALTLTGDPTWLIAGLGSCIDTKRKLSFVMPLFGNGANSFADTYTKARRSASAANEMLARMAVAEARAKADKNFPQDQLTAISSVKANLQAAVDAFVAYDKALNTVPSGSSKSPFDTFVETAALFGDPSAGYLVLQLPEVGASGGTRSRFIGSDKLEFQSTAVATYTLLNKEGAIVVSGATAGADATSMTTVDAEAKLAQMPSDLACSK